MNYKRSTYTSILVLSASFAFCQSQITTPSYSGNIFKNGVAYFGSGYGPGDTGSLNVGSADPLGTTSAATFVPTIDTNFTNVNRIVGYFTSTGAGTFNMPSNNIGGTTVASSAYISTFNNAWMPNMDQFNASVVANGATDGAINYEFRSAPDPLGVRSAGTFSHGLLDGSSYDMNPIAGQTVIDKTLSPMLNIGYTLPSFDFTRSSILWSDGSHSNSPFIDAVASGMWMVFDNGVNVYYIQGSPFSPGQTFAANEGPGTKTVAGYSSSMVADISDLATGTYTVHYQSIGWHTFGTQSQLGGLSFGFYDETQNETSVTIVPEPNGLVAILGLGLLPLLRRRAKRA